MKPFNILNQNLQKRVIVKLKGDKEYRGILDGYDPHMNLILHDAEEYIGNELKRKLTTVCVRGDNVIYISP